MARAFFVTEYPDGTGETGWRCGRRDGYKREDEAVAAAERFAKQRGGRVVYSVDLYDVAGEERDHLETVCYVGGDNV